MQSAETISIVPEPQLGVRRKRQHIARLYQATQLGAMLSALAVFAFFSITAGDKGFLTVAATSGWLNASAELALIAIPVGLLMIAGEFDLSVGSVVGASSITMALGVTVYDLPVPLVFLMCLAIGVLVGLFNGMLVNRTGLPSFIVTLAANYVLLGLALGMSRAMAGTSTVSVDITGFWGNVFGATFGDLNVTVVWCLVLGLVAYWVLSRMSIGSWIYATGGNLDGAIKAGVPTQKVRLALFITTGVAAAIVGALQAALFNSGNAVQGQGFVFQAPIVAVIGGVLLVGGYGTVQGVVLGTITYGMVNIGLFYTGWTTDWLSTFIGGLLIVAVLANDFVRKAALRQASSIPASSPKTTIKRRVQA